MLECIHIDDIIIAALKEDMMSGDITTDCLIDHKSRSKANFIAKQPGVIAGLNVSERVFKIVDKETVFNKIVEDGTYVEKGTVIAEIEGVTRALLKAERTALNYLQRLSGIASITNEYVKRVKDFSVRIVDTRKTTPGLRLLEKYAVKAGGGNNHRFSLSDGVLIKDNHIKAAGGVKPAIQTIRKQVPHTMKIEIEAETYEQVLEALDAGADIIMLDNMTFDEMRKCVKVIDKRAIVEASGNVNLETVCDVAATGVDIISIGGLTHSAKALDISMKIV